MNPAPLCRRALRPLSRACMARRLASTSMLPLQRPLSTVPRLDAVPARVAARVPIAAATTHAPLALGSPTLAARVPHLRVNMLRAYSTTSLPEATRPIVGYHLLACAGLVFLIIIVGGITRLTESGLSITEWNPGLKGMYLPCTDAEWMAEWDKYKESPEFSMLNSHMTLEDFKRIFLWEWSHRILGRFIGVFFVLPALYFSMRRGMTTSATRWKLLAIGAGIGFQGFLGWFMVASGLKNPYENEGKSDRPDWYPRVDHFRLAAHLGAAFLVYMGMLYSAVGILRDAGLVRSMRSSGGADQTSALTTLLTQLQNPKTRAFRRTTLGMLGLVFTTAIYGAFVAGLDAGLLYNEFPTMGGPDRLLPPKDELIDPRYRFRGDAPQQDPSCHQVVLGNLLQNPVTVQAVHRGLGISTLLSMIGYLVYSKRLKSVLPRAAPRFATGAAHMTVLQALLGIGTLVYMVPIPLASLHQGGSVVVLSMLTCVLGVLRRPGRALEALARARDAAKHAARV